MVEQSQPQTKQRCLLQDRSQLPSELLELILKKLPTAMEIMSFKAVCSPWRSTVKAYTSAPCYNLPQNPCLMFQANSGSEKHEEFTCLFDPIGKTVYKLNNNVFVWFPIDHWLGLGSSYGWLSFVEKSKTRKAPTLHLYNPLSTDYIEFPSLPASNSGPFDFGENWRVALSANPSSGNNFVVAVLAGRDVLFGKNGTKEWIGVEGIMGGWRDKYEDIMFRKEHLYAISWRLSLNVWDCREWPPVLSKSMSFDEGSVNEPSSLYYLAESKMGDLFRVVRTMGSASSEEAWHTFCVRKLDETRKKWEKVESLDEEMLFVVKDRATSLCYKSIKGCEANSVYNFECCGGVGIEQHKLEEGDGICQCIRWQAFSTALIYMDYRMVKIKDSV